MQGLIRLSWGLGVSLLPCPTEHLDYITSGVDCQPLFVIFFNFFSVVKVLRLLGLCPPDIINYKA